jgi:hypothetical protein
VLLGLLVVTKTELLQPVAEHKSIFVVAEAVGDGALVIVKDCVLVHTPLIVAVTVYVPAHRLVRLIKF